MKKIIFLLAFMFSSIGLKQVHASLYEAFIDGIYYNFDKNGEACVTYKYRNNNNDKAYSGDVVIPSTITYKSNTYNVTSIGDYAFYNCKLSSITIPNSIKNVGVDAFTISSEGMKIISPDIMKWLDMTCHLQGNDWHLCNEDGTEITEIVIPDGITCIEDNHFYGYSSLTSITIPDGVTSIGKNAFYRCKALVLIEIPNSVKSIGENAFDQCSNLLMASLPNSVKDIGKGAFQYCEKLIKVTIPDGLTKIEDFLFFRCTSLSMPLTIPDDVTAIGGCAFLGVGSKIYLPDNIVKVESSAFDEYSRMIDESTCKSGINLIRH